MATEEYDLDDWYDGVPQPQIEGDLNLDYWYNGEPWTLGETPPPPLVFIPSSTIF